MNNKTLTQIYRDMIMESLYPNAPGSVEEALSPAVAKATQMLKNELAKEKSVSKKMKIADDVMRTILGEGLEGTSQARAVYAKSTPGQESRTNLAIDGVPLPGGAIGKQKPLLGSGIKEDQELDPETIVELEVKRADRSVTITKDGEKRIKPKATIAVEDSQIDELSRDTLASYQKKASDARGHRGLPTAKVDNRYKGVSQASKKLAAKESVEESAPTALHVKQAKGIAFDKRYKGGNMTGATNAIEKMKKGLSNHPEVRKALQRANESTDAYGKSVQQIADKKKKDAMSTSDKQKLGAVADLMKRANEQNEIEEVKVPANYAQMMAKKKKVSQMTPAEKQADAERRKEYNAYQKSKRNESTENTMQEEQMPTGVQVKHIDKNTGKTHATQLFTASDAMRHEKELKKAGHKIHSRAAVYGTKVGPERLMSK